MSWKFLSVPLLVALAVPALGITPVPDSDVIFVATTSGSAMPGDANNFIFFNTADYPFNGPVTGNNDATGYAKLTNFTIAGGLQGNSGFSNDATITTPAGAALKTGFIASNGGSGAFALSPVVPSGTTFNYDDFNVYLMVSNTNGDLNDTVVSLDPRVSGSVNQYAHDAVSFVDNTATGNSAEFIEFNVSGFGAQLMNGTGDLVVTMNGNHNDSGAQSYIGAVSFESIPEPSTYAMLLSGIALLALASRVRVLCRD